MSCLRNDSSTTLFFLARLKSTNATLHQCYSGDIFTTSHFIKWKLRTLATDACKSLLGLISEKYVQSCTNAKCVIKAHTIINFIYDLPSQI